MNIYESESRINNCLSIINKEYKGIKSFKLIHLGVNSTLFELKHFDNQKSIIKMYPNFSNDNRNRLDMPKYVIIGLAIPILLFIIMHFWGKFNDKTKNRIVALVFGVIAVAFVVLISLLIF